MGERQEVTGRLEYDEHSERWWIVPWPSPVVWDFRRRVDALAFAARKGIKLNQEET